MTTVRRPMSRMRKLEAKEALFRQRKRILKYLVHGFLKQEGLLGTADAFHAEAALTDDYELCDNIDLEIILQDYCSYYMIRFNKQPQFCRKSEAATPTRRPKTRAARLRAAEPEPEPEPEPGLPSTFTVTKLLKDFSPEDLEKVIPAVERLPLAGLVAKMGTDKRQLVELVYQDIIKPTGVRWEDVKGLETAKSILMESVVYPVRYPEVFTGVLEPWRGALLHGPPGTGKTLLARALASESRCTFFNVSCGTLVNKWRGESEKIVKVLFEMASYYSPSIIFIDEVETLASERSLAGEHEASRRLKSQLLIELDGVREREGLVFLLANSNMPWEVDKAMLRRLEKRIYIPLPDARARAQLFETYLNVKTVELHPKADYELLAARTDGYSGSEVKLACKEALMMKLRKVLPNMPSEQGSGTGQSARKDRLNIADILAAIEKTKPVSKSLAKRHLDWQEKLGCT